MLPRRSSNRSSSPNIFALYETAAAARDEALESYALHSDDQDTPPNMPGAFTSAPAPNFPLSNIRPTDPSGNNSRNIKGQTPGDDQGIETTAPVNGEKKFGIDSSARRTSCRWNIANLQPPATEPDETGQYESSTCHQCRVKTTRPKMICDQSQDPNCFSRVCDHCLVNRAVYDGVPELQPPIFEFVPGGKMLCVKCRGICPCATCRRQRGEKEENRRGRPDNALSSLQGLKSQSREQELLKKKQIQERVKLKKASSWGAGLRDSAPAERERPSAVSPVTRKRRKKQGGALWGDINFSDQFPANSTGNSTQTASVNPTTMTGLMARDYAEPKPKRGRHLKANPSATTLGNQTLPSNPKEIDREVDNTMVDHLIQSNKRLVEAASGMASLIKSKENPSDPKMSDYARLERSEKELKLKMREIELQNAIDEAARQKAKAEAFEKAKMMQDFLKSGLSYEKAMEATITFLGPST